MVGITDSLHIQYNVTEKVLVELNRNLIKQSSSYVCWFIYKEIITPLLSSFKY